MKKPYSDWTDEEKIKKDERLHRAYMKHIKKSTYKKGSGEGYGVRTIFGSIRENLGALLYENPGEARKVHPHFLEITQILKQNRKKGVIHPLFEPVEMNHVNKRPVLLREMPGKTLDEIFDARECNNITGLIHNYLFPVLLHLGFRDDFFIFDIINGGNIIINNKMKDILFQENLEKLIELESEDIGKLLDHWYEKDGRIYLFDFGSWLKPHRNETGEILYYTNKYGNRVKYIK